MMKTNLKRFLSFVCVICLCFAMTTPIFADETGEPASLMPDLLDEEKAEIISAINEAESVFDIEEILRNNIELDDKYCNEFVFLVLLEEKVYNGCYTDFESVASMIYLAQNLMERLNNEDFFSYTEILLNNAEVLLRGSSMLDRYLSYTEAERNRANQILKEDGPFTNLIMFRNRFDYAVKVARPSSGGGGSSGGSGGTPANPTPTPDPDIDYEELNAEILEKLIEASADIEKNFNIFKTEQSALMFYTINECIKEVINDAQSKVIEKNYFVNYYGNDIETAKGYYEEIKADPMLKARFWDEIASLKLEPTVMLLVDIFGIDVDISFPDEVTPTVIAETTKSRDGDTINVSIAISDNPGVAGMQLQLSYADGLILTEISRGKALENLEFTVPGDLTENPLVLPWDGLMADDSNGIILNLTFLIPEGTPEGFYPIEIECINGGIYDDNLDDVIFDSINGGIEVVDYFPGDINGDGEVGTKDATVLRRYIAGGYDVSVVAQALDVNRDGIITTKDVTTLRRFIAGGYGVELK